MLVKQAINRGASPWTGTFFGNLWLALAWGSVAAVRGEVIPVDVWWQAGIIGLLFVLGQMFTYLAYQFGDVSVATPVFGVKVLMVAALTATLSQTAVPFIIWIAGTMASAGVILIQWAPGISTTARHRQLITIALALTAAFSLSLFDVSLQKWARGWDSYSFLPVMFGAAGLLSLVFLPKVDSPRQLTEKKAIWWMLVGTLLMATQATGMCFTLAEFAELEDAPRINIVYALRGLWGVILAWLLATKLNTSEATVGRPVMIRRLFGAVLLTGAVLLAVTADGN